MLSSLVCCNWHSCSKFITSSMARPSVSSMKTFSLFPSAIILLYTKSITVSVCRQATSSANSALQLIKLIYVEEHNMAPFMARLRTTPKSYGSVNCKRDHSSSLTRHLSVSRVGHLSSMVCSGMGHLSPIFFNYREFHIFTIELNFCFNFY